MVRLSSRIETQLWNAFWCLLAIVLPGVPTYLGSRQQSLFKHLAHAHMPMSGFDGFLVWLPSYVPWLAFIAYAGAALFFIFRRRNTPAPALVPATDADTQNALRVTQEALSQTIKERDVALLELAASRAKVEASYPKMYGVIFEFLPSDPVIGDDLFAAIYMSIANSGADSIVQKFEVQACTTYGGKIRVDITCPKTFTLYIENGTQQIDYPEEFYIMAKTGENVRRGKPVAGILPCIFHGIKSVKEIDFRTLKVRFADGTGDADGNVKWWETAPLEHVELEDAPLKVRPGFPRPRPVTQRPQKASSNE